MSPNGTARNKRYGLNLPQRLDVLSATTPTMGSKTESQIRVTRNIVPTIAAGKPKS